MLLTKDVWEQSVEVIIMGYERGRRRRKRMRRIM
jgi:hypothetical protein